MQEFSLELEETASSGRMKLVIEAVAKIQQGKKLFQEGHLELANLLGEKATKKELRKHGKDRPSTFNMDVRSDETLKEKMIDLVRLNRQASSILFSRKLKISDRRLERLLEALVKEKVFEDVGQGGRHAWILTGHKSKAAKKAAKTRKKQKKLGKVKKSSINGHKVLKSSRGTFIDVTDEKVVNRALDFLKTHDWVNKGQLIKAVDLSPGPLNRLLQYMQKQKLVKQVYKKNNPAHESVKKMYVQDLPYWEAV